MPESLQMGRITLDEVRRALGAPNLDVAVAQFRMTPRPRPIRRPDLPGQPKLAAVLILLYPEGSDLNFPLMRRTEYKGVHSGQISLPGGRQEPGETFDQTALRETNEELGVATPVEILGQLSMIYVPPSDFEIHPFVGYSADKPVWMPDPREVAEVLEAPLSLLVDEQARGVEELVGPDGVTRIFPHYKLNSYKVWGATAAILSEFEARLKVALGII